MNKQPAWDDASFPNPAQRPIRRSLRLVGPTVAGLGLILVAIGMASFFSTFNSFGAGEFGPPRYFWCAFLGFPLLFVGFALSMAGYGATVQRYMSGEMAPVAKDTFNYLAGGVAPGVRDIANAAAEGMSAGLAGGPACLQCQAPVPVGAEFCPACGTRRTGGDCAQCGEALVPGAEFCHRCGARAGGKVSA